MNALSTNNGRVISPPVVSRSFYGGPNQMKINQIIGLIPFFFLVFFLLCPFLPHGEELAEMALKGLQATAASIQLMKAFEPKKKKDEDEEKAIKRLS